MLVSYRTQLHEDEYSADIRNGLYRMVTPASHRVLAITNAFDKWHFRLGPPYNSKLHLVRIYILLFSSSNNVCDACHFAKQRQLPLQPMLWLFLIFVFMVVLWEYLKPRLSQMLCNEQCLLRNRPKGTWLRVEHPAGCTRKPIKQMGKDVFIKTVTFIVIDCQDI